MQLTQPPNKKSRKSAARSLRKGADLQPTLKLLEANTVPEEWKEVIKSPIDAFKAMFSDDLVFRATLKKLKSWISNSIVNLSFTALMKAWFLTMESRAQTSLLEESPLGLGRNFSAPPHLKGISFMQNHIVE